MPELAESVGEALGPACEQDAFWLTVLRGQDIVFANSGQWGDLGLKFRTG